MKTQFSLFLVLFFGTTLFGGNFSVSTTAELRYALQVAEENNESDLIVLQSGFYSVVEDGVGQLEYNSTKEDNLTIVGIDKNTTLSGFELSRIFYRLLA